MNLTRNEAYAKALKEAEEAYKAHKIKVYTMQLIDPNSSGEVKEKARKELTNLSITK